MIRGGWPRTHTRLEARSLDSFSGAKRSGTRWKVQEELHEMRLCEVRAFATKGLQNFPIVRIAAGSLLIDDQPSSNRCSNEHNNSQCCQHAHEWGLTAQMRLDPFDEPVHVATKITVGPDLNAVAIGE